jgi:hypothetical protein
VRRAETWIDSITDISIGRHVVKLDMHVKKEVMEDGKRGT